VTIWGALEYPDKAEALNRRIFKMWMACATFDEIAEATDCDKATASRTVDDLLQNGGLAKAQQAAAEHATDFDPPIYNIWKQQEKTGGSGHFGNSEVCWVVRKAIAAFPTDRPSPPQSE
jgi:hypothetical protein